MQIKLEAAQAREKQAAAMIEDVCKQSETCYLEDYGDLRKVKEIAFMDCPLDPMGKVTTALWRIA